MTSLADLPPPRLGDRALFPDLAASAYLNHAAMSPPSLRVRAAVQTVADVYARRGAAAWLHFAEQRTELRQRLAALLGVQADTIGFVPNTSHGVTTIAMCLPWRRGDRVLLLRGEFPANITPWQRAAALFDLEIVWLDAQAFAAGGPGLQQLEDQLRAGLRLLAVSAVQFQTGLRMPLAAITAACHRFGCEVFVDAIQALGAVPLDAVALGIDYLAAGAHKWLMGMEGAGVLYVAPACIDALEPRLASWLSHVDGTRFLFEGAGHLRYDRAIRRRTDFTENGVVGSLSYAALHAAVGVLLEVGVPALHAHVQGLLVPLAAGLRALGCRVAQEPGTAYSACILSAELPTPGQLPALWRALDAQGVACASPDGYLRFSPHWHNHADDIRIAVAAVRHALQG